MKFKYFLTFHAVERLQQRFSSITNQNEKIKNWNRKNKETASVKSVFDQLLFEAEENKSFKNNTRYMTTIYEKYGFDDEYKFLENKEHGILFVMKKPRDKNDFSLVTLMPVEYKNNNALSNVKYNGKKKKSEINKDKFLSSYEQVKKNIFPFENEDLNILLRIRNLEENSNFEIFHQRSLLNILTILDKKELYKTEEANRVFVSENRTYKYKKNGNEIILLHITENSLKVRLKTVEDFNIMIEIERNLSQSRIVRKLKEGIEQRVIKIGEKEYEFNYNEKTESVVSYSLMKEKAVVKEVVKETPKKEKRYNNINEKIVINSEDLLKHALDNCFEKKIQDKIKRTHFITLSKVDYKNVLCKTQIEDKEVHFNYSVFDKKIKINKVRNLFNNQEHFKFVNEELKELLIRKDGNFDIVKELAWNKKVKKAIIFNQEIEFIHINGESDVTILSIKDNVFEKKNNPFQKSALKHTI